MSTVFHKETFHLSVPSDYLSGCHIEWGCHIDYYCAVFEFLHTRKTGYEKQWRHASAFNIMSDPQSHCNCISLLITFRNLKGEIYFNIRISWPGVIGPPRLTLFGRQTYSWSKSIVDGYLFSCPVIINKNSISETLAAVYFVSFNHYVDVVHITMDQVPFVQFLKSIMSTIIHAGFQREPLDFSIFAAHSLLTNLGIQ